MDMELAILGTSISTLPHGRHDVDLDASPGQCRGQIGDMLSETAHNVRRILPAEHQYAHRNTSLFWAYPGADYRLPRRWAQRNPTSQDACSNQSASLESVAR